ncbi:MAG: L-lactate dehydrogenase [Ruminococcaceae bacterium]|nr:L-lactate dehydrogenase [Oscillospiraceae bacterium]
MLNPRKCAIVGAGNVGATTAFSLMQSALFSEILLIDINQKRAIGEAADLGHTVPFLSPTEIYAGDYADLADAALIIITAGAAQAPGETRLDLVRKNVRIFHTVLRDICKFNYEAILLVVTNPVDILTEVARQLSGFPASRVIGSGTVLDTARLKFLLGQQLGVDARHVHAFIIGEHGDTEFPVYSSANISGIDLDHFCNADCPRCGEQDLQRLFEQTRDAAYHIIEAKGSTYYAIAEAVRRIATAILRDEAAILPVSVAAQGVYGLQRISLSLPCVLGKNGVTKVLEIPLSDAEEVLLQRSAQRMRQVLSDIGFAPETQLV